MATKVKQSTKKVATRAAKKAVRKAVKKAVRKAGQKKAQKGKKASVKIKAGKGEWTQLTVLLDRSGSMEGIASDIIGGYNHFLSEQKAQPGKATLTLVQFDSENPFEVIHDSKAVKEVPPLDKGTFVPRGGTPLLDAMGRTITDMDKLTEVSWPDYKAGDALPAGAKPSPVPDRMVLVVVTDGLENQSREFTRERVSKMIQERQEKKGWQVVFLSADMAAIGEARELGVYERSSSRFRTENGGSRRAMMHLSEMVSSYRKGESEEITIDEKKI